MSVTDGLMLMPLKELEDTFMTMQLSQALLLKYVSSIYKLTLKRILHR